MHNLSPGQHLWMATVRDRTMSSDDLQRRVQLAAEALRQVPAHQRDARLADAVTAFEKILLKEKPMLPRAAVAAECLRFAGGVLERLGEPPQSDLATAKPLVIVGIPGPAGAVDSAGLGQFPIGLQGGDGDR